jgi:hypothetical protein
MYQSVQFNRDRLDAAKAVFKKGTTHSRAASVAAPAA